MATEVSLSCAPGPVISSDAATAICREFRGVLAEKFPQHRFSEGDGAPGIALTVTKANARSLGLEVVWIAADGTRTAGIPLSTAFFDRNSDEMRRRRFYESFLQENPLPF